MVDAHHRLRRRQGPRLIKSDGQAAYFAGDVAYYLNKRERGADAAIYLLGADHHGYIGRMMAMCAASVTSPGLTYRSSLVS